MLADPRNPATPLPDPILSGQRPQPRPATRRCHLRRPHRQPLDATHPSMIN